LLRIFGRSFRAKDKPGKRVDKYVSKRTTYRWETERTLDAAILLEAIKDFLIIKRGAAEKVLEYCRDRVTAYYGSEVYKLLVRDRLVVCGAGLRQNKEQRCAGASLGASWEGSATASSPSWPTRFLHLRSW